jgi:Leucine-rich repeat (LRR) protein
LKYLYLEENDLDNESIKEIKKLEYLMELDLSKNKIKDLNVIENMKYLQHLNIEENEIENISFLKKIYDIGGFQAQTEKQIINITHNNLNLGKNTKDRLTVEKLSEAKVNIIWKDGNNT